MKRIASTRGVYLTRAEWDKHITKIVIMLMIVFVIGLFIGDIFGNA